MSVSTLHEIAVHFAKKQPGMADTLTEDSPILKTVRWKAASHKQWNVAEKTVSIEGPGFTEPDAPLPMMNASTDLVHTDLHLLGGMMEVPTQKALKFGGAARYFAERQDMILRHAGMKTEKQLVMENWLRAARAAKNLRDAGGKCKGWFVLAVRYDELLNIGLFDPDQFKSGTLLTISAINNGAEHTLQSERHRGVLGYAVAYRGTFGWQCLEPRLTCSAIVNVDEANAPSAAMIDDMLADVRAQAGNTYIFTSLRGKTYAVNPHKSEHLHMAVQDKGMQTMLDSWNGIPIVCSHNFNDKIANVTVPA